MVKPLRNSADNNGSDADGLVNNATLMVLLEADSDDGGGGGGEPPDENLYA